MKRFTLLLSMFFLLLRLHGQSLPGTFTSSWLGNTFGGRANTGNANASDVNDDWVQDYIDCMTVTDDGTCYTTSGWDEAGRSKGIYKNGDVLGNGGTVANCGTAGGFTINGTTITGNGKTITDAGQPTAIAMGKGDFAGKLLVADNGARKQILVYDVSGTPTIVERIGAEGGIAAGFTIAYDLPASTNAPAYPAGKYGPGVYHPLKLWGITGVGCDNQGRVFVSTSELGTAIRCFKKVSSNWILDWRVENYCFVDNVYYDVNSDAIDLYGVQEHYKMNFNTSTPGQEWSIYGYSLDSYNYPQDPRGITDIKAGHEHGLTGTVMREINGTRYLWTSGMTCQAPNIFKYKPGTEVAVPCGMFMQRNHRIYDFPITYWWPPQRPSTDKDNTMFWEDLNDNGQYDANEYTDQTLDFGGGDFYVDESGNIWQGKNPITVWNAKILPNGNIHYSSDNVTTYQINNIPGIGKIVCQKDKDRLVIETAACRDLDGGQVYVVNNFWKGGNRDATLVSTLKHPLTDPNNSEISSWTAAGDYGFEVGWASRAEVWVTDLRTGELVGTMEPTVACGGINRTGWVDISAGIQAYKRHNGEYLVFVEDDYLSRVMMYRWTPVPCNIAVTGIDFSSPTITLNGIVKDTLIATISPSDACNNTIIWTSSNTDVATVNSSGVVTTITPGTTIITATTQDGNKTATCEITVNNVAVTDVSLNPSSAKIAIDETLQLTPTVMPSNAVNKNISWNSDNTDVATVSQSGLVKPVALGDAVITVTSEDGNKTASCSITVALIPVTSIAIKDTAMNLSVGELQTLTAAIAPLNASNKTVSWSSSDDLITTVDANGKIKGIAVGTAKIYVTSNDGGLKDSITIKVLIQGTILESFDYPAGDIDGKGTAADGWGGPWLKSSGLMEVVDGNLGNDVVGKFAKTSIGLDYINYTRELSTKWVDDGSDIWISFYIKRDNTTPLSWGGLSLFNDGSEDIFIGCPNGSSTIGFNDVTSNIPTTSLNFILVKCEMNGTDEPDKAYMWVNHEGAAAPDVSTALISKSWGTNGFTKIRIANDQTYSVSYDKIRIGRTYYNDFQETAVTGITVDPSTLNLKTGAKSNLTVTILPADATIKTVNFQSSNEAVAKVSSVGLVTAVTPGIATITATSTSGSKTATCQVTVASGDGIEDIVSSSLKLSPNPVIDVLNLSVFADKIDIYTVEGKYILSGKGKSIDLSGLHSGIYLVKIYLNGQLVTKKVFK